MALYQLLYLAFMSLMILSVDGAIILERQDVISTTSSAAPSTSWAALISPSAMSGSSTAAAEAAASSTDSSADSAASSILDGTNDPDHCHIDLDASDGLLTNVLCEPAPNSTHGYNADVLVTWDPAIFPVDSMAAVELYNVSTLAHQSFGEAIGLEDEALYISPKISTSTGATYITTTKSMVNTSSGATSQQILLLLAIYPTEGAPPIHEPAISIFVTNNNANSSSDGSTSSTGKKIGEGVGIPVGIIVLFAFIAGGIFLCVRSRKSAQGISRTRGHHRSTSSAGSFSAFKAKLGGRHKRSESFHDEPTRGAGVEMQSPIKKSMDAVQEEKPWEFGTAGTNSGGAGENTWGWAGMSSPKGHSKQDSVTSTDGNVFREEIGRQKGERGW